MARELPNLDWLRVFGSCASSGSFAIAAQDLGVTPGAVSQRIKALEAFLAVPLFKRMPQGVCLTEAGRRYAEQVRPALDQLVQATRAVARDKVGQPVRVTVLPALAQLWLGPRLETFHQQHEGVSIEIWADPAVVDLRSSPFDLAIRYGKPPFAGCDHRLFLVDELVPVASPKLLSRCKIDNLGLPIGAPLLLDTYWSNDFDMWLDGISHSRPHHATRQTFSLYSMVVEAALSGRGFMIGHSSLIGDLIAAGELISLSERRVRSPNQFYIVTVKDRPLDGLSQKLLDWLTMAGQTAPG